MFKKYYFILILFSELSLANNLNNERIKQIENEKKAKEEALNQSLTNYFKTDKDINNDAKKYINYKKINSKTEKQIMNSLSIEGKNNNFYFFRSLSKPEINIYYMKINEEIKQKLPCPEAFSVASVNFPMDSNKMAMSIQYSTCSNSCKVIEEQTINKEIFLADPVFVNLNVCKIIWKGNESFIKRINYE